MSRLSDPDIADRIDPTDGLPVDLSDATDTGAGGHAHAHGDLSGVGTDDHHSESHGHSHGSLSGVGTGDHHARDHASTHGPSAADALRLDNLEAPEDNTDLNVTSSAHGLCPKAPADATKFLNGANPPAYAVPAGGASDIGCRVYRSTDQDIVHNTATALSFSHERWDTDTMWVIGSPTRITFNSAGTYVAGAVIRWEFDADGYRQLGLRLNGPSGGGGFHISIVKLAPVPGASTTTTMMECVTVWKFEEGDYLEVMVRHTAGNNLEVDNANAFSAEVFAQLIAAA